MSTKVTTVALTADLFGGCDSGEKEALPGAASLANVLDTVRSQMADYVYHYQVARKRSRLRQDEGGSQSSIVTHPWTIRAVLYQWVHAVPIIVLANQKEWRRAMCHRRGCFRYGRAVGGTGYCSDTCQLANCLVLGRTVNMNDCKDFDLERVILLVLSMKFPEIHKKIQSFEPNRIRYQALDHKYQELLRVLRCVESTLQGCQKAHQTVSEVLQKTSDPS